MAEQWLKAIAVSEVPAQGFLALQLAGQPVLVGRANGRLFACRDRCPHAAAPLRQGRLSGAELQCARHGWTFDVLTGASVPGPTAFALGSLPLKVEGNMVLLGLEDTSQGSEGAGGAPLEPNK